MVNQLSDIQIRIEDEVYSKRIKFPVLSSQSIDSRYLCNESIKAKTIIYTTESNGKKEVVENEQ